VEGTEKVKLGDGSRLASWTIPISGEIALAAGNMLRTYRRSHGTELGDALIASTAVEIDATLITRNVKHYPMSAVTVLRPY
jgi:predicted nucleic acid-binding protein